MQWSCAWELVRELVPAVPSSLAVYTTPQKLDCGESGNVELPEKTGRTCARIQYPSLVRLKI